jgi:hypothetical protein
MKPSHFRTEYEQEQRAIAHTLPLVAEPGPEVSQSLSIQASPEQPLFVSPPMYETLATPASTNEIRREPRRSRRVKQAPPRKTPSAEGGEVEDVYGFGALGGDAD